MMPRNSAQTSGRTDGEPKPEELTVRFKRRWFINRQSTAGVVTSMMFSLLGPFLPEALSAGLIAAPLLVGFNPQSPAFRRYFAYDRVNRTIVAVNRWGRWRQYPREPRAWLSLRESTGEVFECRPDGERDLLPIKRKLAKREDWNAFMARFRRDHR